MAWRSAPCVRPKARTILRPSTSPGWLATKARISSRVGRAATRGWDRDRFTAGGAHSGTELSTNSPFCHPHPFALFARALAAGSDTGTDAGGCFGNGLLSEGLLREGLDFAAVAAFAAGAFAPFVAPAFVAAVFPAGVFATGFAAGLAFVASALAFDFFALGASVAAGSAVF